PARPRVHLLLALARLDAGAICKREAGSVPASRRYNAKEAENGGVMRNRTDERLSKAIENLRAKLRENVELLIEKGLASRSELGSLFLPSHGARRTPARDDR